MQSFASKLFMFQSQLCPPKNKPLKTSTMDCLQCLCKNKPPKTSPLMGMIADENDLEENQSKIIFFTEI